MTAEIVHLRRSPINLVKPPGSPDGVNAQSAEHLAFCLARRAVYERLTAWLRADGDAATIQEETKAAAAVMQQLIELERGQ